MVHLLLFLILLRLFARRGLRDLRDAGLLSFFMLVAASSVSFNVGFLFVFVAFLLLGTWMLILNHVVTELELAGRRGDVATAARRVFFRGPLTQVSLVAAAITFALAAGLFFVIPRVGQAALPLRASIGRMVTGFSDRVELGASARSRATDSVVMRVYLPDERLDPDHAARAALARRRLRPVRRPDVVERGRRRGGSCAARSPATSGSGCPAGRAHRAPGDLSSSRSAPTRSSRRPRALRLEMRSPSLVVDDMGSLTVSSPGGAPALRRWSPSSRAPAAASVRAARPSARADRRRARAVSSSSRRWRPRSRASPAR